MKLLVRLKSATALAALAGIIAGCGGAPGNGNAGVDSASSGTARTIDNGPAADYPLVVGDPFTIGDVTYTPLDTLNYDEVGYAAMGDPGETGVTGAHKTLPYPSYVEVTALDTGRTALIRIEGRGPMDNGRLISLSSMAAAQLGVAEGAPVRVRRVNPPEDERAELRSRHEAPLRMETPRGLLDVLRRKLPAATPLAMLAPAAAVAAPAVPANDVAPSSMDDFDLPAVELPPQRDKTDGPPPAAPTAVPVPNTLEGNAPVSGEANTTPRNGAFVVQVGAFSVRANADRLAERVDGHVTERGKLALVRVGPFESRGQAEQALAKLRGQGYKDVRIESVR